MDFGDLNQNHYLNILMRFIKGYFQKVMLEEFLPVSNMFNKN